MEPRQPHYHTSCAQRKDAEGPADRQQHAWPLALCLGVRTLEACPTPTLACSVAFNKWFALQATVLPNGKWIPCSNSEISVKINKPEAKEADPTLAYPGQAGNPLPNQKGQCGVHPCGPGSLPTPFLDQQPTADLLLFPVFPLLL